MYAQYALLTIQQQPSAGSNLKSILISNSDWTHSVIIQPAAACSRQILCRSLSVYVHVLTTFTAVPSLLSLSSSDHHDAQLLNRLNRTELKLDLCHSLDRQTSLRLLLFQRVLTLFKRFLAVFKEFYCQYYNIFHRCSAERERKTERYKYGSGSDTGRECPYCPMLNISETKRFRGSCPVGSP